MTYVDLLGGERGDQTSGVLRDMFLVLGKQPVLVKSSDVGTRRL